MSRLTRRDLVYLGVDDRREQDTLLTAASLLHTSGPAPLTRMDSGYYDGQSESTTSSEGSGSTTASAVLTRYSSLDSFNELRESNKKCSAKKASQGLNLQYFDSVSKHRNGGERRTSLSESLFSLAAKPDRHLNKSF